MTKMIKMSLIAAVAVTGMTSTVCAQPLEEAIKGVDVSGMLRYRYDDRQLTEKETGFTDDKTSNQWNNYRLDVNTKAKVNDTVTANVTVGIGAVAVDNTGSGANLADNVEGPADLGVRNANFTFALPVATVIAGKQSIPGPFVDNTVDDISRGTGIVALVPAGPVTIAAGHFVAHSVTATGDDITGDLTAGQKTNISSYLRAKNATELAVLGNVSGVSFDAWYVDVTDAAQGLSIGAKASVAGITVDARHSTMDVQDTYVGVLTAATTTALQLNGESSVTKLVASTKVGVATAKAGLALTGKHNGTLGNRMALDGDNDAQTDLKLWQLSAGTLPDATAFVIGAGMEVMPSVTVTADYLMASGKISDTALVGATSIDLDASEFLVGATYAMSKNFSVHARYSMASTEFSRAGWSYEEEKTRGRLELKYSF